MLLYHLVGSWGLWPACEIEFPVCSLLGQFFLYFLIYVLEAGNQLGWTKVISSFKLLEDVVEWELFQKLWKRLITIKYSNLSRKKNLKTKYLAVGI